MVVDTDAPIESQLVDEALSADAAIDSLKIDVLDATSQKLLDSEDFVVPDANDWPVSFGVNWPDEVLIRIRAFRAIFTRRFGLDPSVAPEPVTEATIDRLVRLRLPDAGVATTRIVLDSECRGIRSNYTPPFSTCVDAVRTQVSPDEGIEALDDVPTSTLAGTWAGARAVPCQAAPLPGRKCIPGGFTLLGELDLLSFDEFAIEKSTPLVPVVLSPYWLDELEVTVGDVRPIASELPGVAGSGSEFCTWLSPTNGANDDYPLNCIDWDTASIACDIRGGRLPREAEWEHAARGRGERRPQIWGTAPISCCIASVSRDTGLSPVGSVCPGLGPEKVGAHRPSSECQDLGDISRDGVLDMAGSLIELTRDHLEPYDDACWKPNQGVLRDPECITPEKDHVARGSAWETGMALVHPARRSQDAISPSEGFRCAYEDSP